MCHKVQLTYRPSYSTSDISHSQILALWFVLVLKYINLSKVSILENKKEEKQGNEHLNFTIEGEKEGDEKDERRQKYVQGMKIMGRAQNWERCVRSMEIDRNMHCKENEPLIVSYSAPSPIFVLQLDHKLYPPWKYISMLKMEKNSHAHRHNHSCRSGCSILYHTHFGPKNRYCTTPIIRIMT